jgi:AraC-like DNA-binding protein
MYGDCSLDNFRHYEGTVDHSIDVLYTWNEAGELTGVAVDIPCPSQVHELHYYTTADYWTSVRKYLKDSFGDVYVLPMCGAAGDQNPLNLTLISKNNKEELIHWNAQATEVIRNIDLNKECDAIGRRVRDAVLRSYEEAKDNIQTDPVLKTKAIEIELPLRKVSKEEYEELYSELPYLTDESFAGLIDLLSHILFEKAIEVDYDKFISAATGYIDENLHRTITIEEMCRELYISKNLLYKKFRDFFDCTVNEYITLKRLERAKLMLDTTADSSKRIAENCGFDNYSYFSRLFKKKNGVSPRDYRHRQ